MAEQPTSPPFDPMVVLGKLRDIVGNNKSPSGGGSSWLSTLIIIAAAIAGVAVWAWISQRRNRELAKLRHAAFVVKLKSEQDAVDLQLAANTVQHDEASKIIAEADKKLQVIEADIKAEEARYAADLQAIDRIRAWRDIDPRSR